MSQPRQSRALVIVNTDFCSSDGDGVLRARRGAKREAEKLSKTLSQLNYRVKLTHNRTAKEIEDLYQQECSREHGDYFVSIIASHRKEGAVFGCDCEPVKLTRIFRILSAQNCPVLAERPKVFFIQVTQLLAGSLMPFCEEKPRTPKPASRKMLPGASDAALPPPPSAGYGAFLNPSGSMFLRALLRALDGEERHLALGRLATRLNGDVAFGCQARGAHEGCKQMPCFVTNLPWEVFLFSAEPESCRLLPSPAPREKLEEGERQLGCKKPPAT
ncbi:CASP3 protein, partial [Chauna torquata]|nr:CASP3 protein [Chauna torquata]